LVVVQGNAADYALWRNNYQFRIKEESDMKRIIALVKRLSFLGYCTFEIENIIKEAIGIDIIGDLSNTQEVAVIQHLEMYEQLGSNYLQTYSK
jgi:hypothetical protein